MSVIGLDIGGSRVKGVLWRDEELQQRISQPYEHPSPARLRAAVQEVVGQWDAQAVGLAVPGVLDEDRSRIVQSANLPGLTGVLLKSLTDKFLKVVASDAVAAATDVAAGMKQRGRLLAISLGTGVGAAVLDVDDGQRLGRVLRVNGDSPGHLGQVDVSLTDDPPVGPDGGAGGAEAYLGREALSGKDLGRLTVEDEPVRALVRLLRIGHALYRPDRIALLGGVALGMRHLKEDLQVSTQHQLTGLSRPGWELTFATDTFHAARGAARLAEANQ